MSDKTILILQLIATIMTILSPFVAFLIAWYTSKQSSKDVKKQIESIKAMSNLQLNAQIEMFLLEYKKVNAEISTLENEKSNISSSISSPLTSLMYSMESKNEMELKRNSLNTIIEKNKIISSYLQQRIKEIKELQENFNK